jgi:hypothetical protein
MTIRIALPVLLVAFARRIATWSIRRRTDSTDSSLSMVRRGVSIRMQFRPAVIVAERRRPEISPRLQASCFSPWRVQPIAT